MSTRVNRYNSQFTVKYSPLSVYDAAVNLLYPLGGGIKRRCASDVCLTSVTYIRTAGWGGAYWLIGPGPAGLAQGCRCALPLLQRFRCCARGAGHIVAASRTVCCKAQVLAAWQFNLVRSCFCSMHSVKIHKH